MSVEVLPGRVFHWESARRPGVVKRCDNFYRTASPQRHWMPSPSSCLLTCISTTPGGGASTLSPGGSTLGPDTFRESGDAFVGSRMSSGRAARSSSSEGNGATSTAAAREVKQYLNRTLFPRPSSTLHGYASLYHRLRRLPASHRKARKTTVPQPDSDSGSSSVLREDGRFECDEVDSIKAAQVPSPARVEIHIYVPTAASTSSATTTTTAALAS